MFCNACGQPIEPTARFCGQCGAQHITVNSTVAPIQQTAHSPYPPASPQDRLRKAKVLVAVLCIMLGALSLSALHVWAASLALLALFVVAVGWSARSIKLLTKIGFVVIALILVIGVNALQVLIEHRASDEREKAQLAIDAQKRAEELQAERNAETVFDRMTPEEHFASAKKKLRIDSDPAEVDEGLKNLQALNGTKLEKQARELRTHYDELKIQEEHAKAVEQAKETAREAKESAEAEEGLRLEYAKTVEESLLRSNMNVDVTAYGPQHKFLKLKWVLASKALAFNFSEQRQDMLSQMRQYGFTKFTITDGYDESWTWNLSK